MSQDDSVALNLDKDVLLDILKRAASQDRTVMEFQTRETDSGRELHQVMDITDHVNSLEE